MARRMVNPRLHPAQKKMILDFSGAVSLRNMPKKASEIDQLLIAFRTTEPDRYQEAYDIIVDKKVPSGNNSAMVAAKVTEIVESNISFQESNAINKLTTAFHEQIKKGNIEIRAEAIKEIEKAKRDFITFKVKIGSHKAKEIKGVLCEQFPRLLQLAQQRINIMMVGPAGCGKTHIAGQLADALDLDYASQSCSAGMSESQLTGWLLPIGKSGSFTYVSSEFIRIYENGGIFLFDEMDAADPNVLIFINQALANGRFSLPQRFENPTVRKHKNFVAIAATNTFGGGADAMYHARNALDASTLDRFKIGMVSIDYSHTVETALCDSTVLSWGRKVREVITQHGMRKIMSTRVIKDGTTMMQGQDWTLNQIAEGYFADWSPEELAIMKRNYPFAAAPDEEIS